MRDAAANERPLFAADSMGKSFGTKTVLKAATVWARAGKITALFGRNGSGKSTLLKLAVGVLRADFGVVHYDCESYLRPTLHRLANRGLFYLPDRDLLSPRWTVAQHLHAVQWSSGSAGTSTEISPLLGISDLLDRRPDQLSGGERRRTEIAIASVRRPRCLLADEPFAGIAPSDAEVIGHSLVAMARGGCAIVVTGHEVPQLMEIADEVVWMVAGTTHGIGTPKEAAAHEQFRRDYLGPAR